MDGLSQGSRHARPLCSPCSSCSLAAPARRGASPIVVHAGRLIADPSQPAAQGPSTITIVDGRIQSVAAGLIPAPAGARLIDLSTRTVLPGLIDLHVHLSGDPGGDYRDEAVDSDEYAALRGVKNARITLRAGFTTVRDLGSGAAGRLRARPRHRRGADRRARGSSPPARPSRSSAAMATSPASAPK